MTTLGIRCSNTDFSFAVISGSNDSPDLIENKTILYPRGYSAPEKMKWLLQELESLNEKHNIDCWAIKSTETIAAKGKAYASRVEFEAMVSLSAANSGSSNVIRKVKSTIAKDLGLIGKAKALKDDLDYSLIQDLENKTEKEFESIVVAWSTL